MTFPSSEIGYGTSLASLNSIYTLIKCSKVLIGNLSSGGIGFPLTFESLKGGKISVKSIVSVLITGLNAYEGNILFF